MRHAHVILFAVTLGSIIHTSQGQAVPSVHLQCQSACPSTNPTCCDCCSTDSYCAGNVISKRCCPQDSGFCGCISNRAYCSGYVFGSTANVNGSNSFGTCYDTSTSSCAYDPNPNVWVVCPNTHQICKSNSFFTCCAPGTSCTTTLSDSYPVCAPDTPICPSFLSTCGNACYQDSAYCCEENALVQKQFCKVGGSSGPQNTNCPAGLSSCGDACYDVNQYCCRSGNLVQAQFCSATSTSICDGKCNGASCCATPSGPQCYDTSSHVCSTDDQGNSGVCRIGTQSCGGACFAASQYHCSGGQLIFGPA